jgi:hypothetical protein
MSPGPLLRSAESTYPTFEAPAATDPAFRVVSLRPSLAPGATRVLAALTDGIVRSGRGVAAATAGHRHATSAVVTSPPGDRRILHILRDDQGFRNVIGWFRVRPFASLIRDPEPEPE